MPAATLSSALPPPRFTSATVEDADDDGVDARAAPSSSLSTTTTSTPPPRGQRRGWKPTRQEDFADGGAYPECHIAQYPLEMGRKKSGASGGALALQVDVDGNVRYDAIVQQGRREGQRVQSQHKDLVPLSQRAESSHAASSLLPDRPDSQAVAECAARTRAALEKITNGKIATAAPTHVASTQGNSSYIRYTPGAASANGQQRIIKMTETVEDPLEPPRWKFKKVPKGPPSPPPPVLRSPPRKVTPQEAKEWVVPPSISNWKNNKGYTIALDKRLAADGRGLQDVHVNDGFASFSEALSLAERHAREEVRQRSLMQQKLAAKEKQSREEHLRQLAQRAREERSGVASASASANAHPNRPRAADFDGSDDDAGVSDDDRVERTSAPVNWGPPSARRSRSRSRTPRSSSPSSASSSSDDEDARARDRLRAERRRERERELRMSSMGNEQRAKHLLREQNRDISEKVALGLAKPTAKGGEVDQRLFNQEKLNASFGADDDYNVYDRPLLQGSNAAHVIYSRPTQAANDEAYGGGTAEGVGEELSRNDRFGLGRSKAFSGAGDEAADGGVGARSGPVVFERDAAPQTVNDPFAIDQFLEEAKRGGGSGGGEGAAPSGTKREGLQQGGARSSAKRHKDGE